MEIRVKITRVLPIESGTSASGYTWSSQTFVGETFDQFQSTIAFKISPDKEGNWRVKAPAEGDDVNVSFDIESREFNGRFYTNIKAWKVEPGTSVTDTAQPQQPYLAESTPVVPTAPAPQQPFLAAAKTSPIPENDLPF